MLAVMILSVIAPPATYNCVRRCPVGPAGRPPHLLLWKVAPGTPSTLPAYAQVDLSAPLPDHAWSPANPPATCYQRSAKPNLCRSSPSLSRPGQRGTHPCSRCTIRSFAGRRDLWCAKSRRSGRSLPVAASRPGLPAAQRPQTTLRMLAPRADRRDHPPEPPPPPPPPPPFFPPLLYAPTFFFFPRRWIPRP